MISIELQLRLWWIIAIGVSFWACFILIDRTWTEWQENPTIMNIIDETDISEIPFPTVAVCPDIKAVKEKLDLESKFVSYQKLAPNLTKSE